MDENSTTDEANNNNKLSIEMINKEENMKRRNKGHKRNKYHETSDLIHLLPKNSSKTSPASTNMESAKRKMQI